ncbi:hypothetical protein KEJ27_10535, partial [Candidatus Bathyarchaeota archaeon]|nr:hypothetical protein [Candidatus Bathyarchaeota archaeon]
SAPYEYIVLLTLSTILSYLQDYVETVPYILLIGDTESGKTRALEVMQILGFRPGFFVDVPAADIYEYLGREADRTTGIILEDEFEDVFSNEEKRRLWKAGYKKGAKVPRIIQSERTGRRKQVFFNCYCFKMAASERLPTGSKAKGLLERCIVLLMVYGVPERVEIDETDYASADPIRLDILKLRVMLYGKHLPEEEPIFTIESGGKSMRYELKGRNRELWIPLLKVGKLTGHYEEALEVCRFFLEKRIKAKMESLEGFLTRAIYELYKIDSKRLDYTIDEIFGKLVEVVNGEVKDGKIISEVFDEEISKQKIGHRLREAFKGERIMRRREGQVERVWRFKKEELETMFKKYLVTDVTDVPILESVKPFSSMEKLMEKTTEKEVKVPPGVDFSVTSVTYGDFNILRQMIKDYSEIYNLPFLKILKEKSEVKAEEFYKTIYEIFQNNELKERLKSEYEGLKLSKPVGRLLVKKEGSCFRTMFEVDLDGLAELYQRLSALKTEALEEECVKCVFFRTPACKMMNYNLLLPSAKPCEKFFRKIEADSPLEEKIEFMRKIYDKIKIDEFMEKALFLKIIEHIFYDVNAEEFYEYLKKNGFILERGDGWFRWVH